MVQAPINPAMKVGMPGLGERLRGARRAAGLTQEALAERLEVSWMTVHRWEHDTRPIRYQFLTGICLCLDVEIGVLVPGLLAEGSLVDAA